MKKHEVEPANNVVSEMLDGQCAVHMAITRSIDRDHWEQLGELASLIQSVHSQGKPAKRGSPASKTPSGQPRARVVEGLSYEDGYRNGHADRLLGVRSTYAQAPEHGHYAMGYEHGVLGLEPRDPFAPHNRKPLRTSV